MKCTKCGTENEDSCLFCKNCGTMLGKAAVNTAAQPAAGGQGAATAAGSNKNVLLIGGLALAAAILVTFVGIALVLGKDNGKAKQAGRVEPETVVTEVSAEPGNQNESEAAGDETTFMEERQSDIGENPSTPDKAVTKLADSEPAADSIQASEYILEYSSARFLTKDELAGFDADTCRLARNEIYARHGRKFDDEGLQMHFNSCSWYHGVIEAADFQESMLSEIEIANRDLIVEYEKEMGYR